MDKFIRYLVKNNYSENTIKTYRSVLNQYVDDLKSVAILKKRLRNCNLSPNTIHLHVNVLLSFMKFNNDKRVSSLKELKLPNIPVKYHKTFSRNYLIKRTTFNESETILLKRKKTLVRFLFETGIRASEVFHISKITNDTLIVLGKGNKKREVFHNKETTSQLGDLDFTYKTLRIWTKEVLGNQYTPHSIRRSFATHMLLKGVNPKMVSRQLGHSKIETTFRYLHTSKQQNYREYKKHILN